MSLSEPLRKQISELVAQHRVVLFMKGTRSMPQCGFSAQVVKILDTLLPSYETVDALHSPDIRDGIKAFSEWPTIPQLYIDGQFLGGCDIVREMYASGELQELIGAQALGPFRMPKITVSKAAAKAFEEARADSAGNPLRLKIDGDFQHELSFGPLEPGDVEVCMEGLVFLLDRSSASRANGVSIEFTAGPDGEFTIYNPNEPPKVKQLSASELKVRLDRGEIILFDVRPVNERLLASIAGVRPLDAAGQEYLLGLNRDAPVAFHCHHGIRSQEAAQQLLGEGFRHIYNLKGGIDSWSLTIDASVPRY